MTAADFSWDCIAEGNSKSCVLRLRALLVFSMHAEMDFSGECDLIPSKRKSEKPNKSPEAACCALRRAFAKTCRDLYESNPIESEEPCPE